jgi:hypothetical protein
LLSEVTLKLVVYFFLSYLFNDFDVSIRLTQNNFAYKMFKLSNESYNLYLCSNVIFNFLSPLLSSQSTTIPSINLISSSDFEVFLREIVVFCTFTFSRFKKKSGPLSRLIYLLRQKKFFSDFVFCHK